MIHRGLTAGLVGNIMKENGSISGADVGCQGEVGVACAMAGAACAQLLGGSIYQIEYAAEMSIILGSPAIPLWDWSRFHASSAM